MVEELTKIQLQKVRRRRFKAASMWFTDKDIISIKELKDFYDLKDLIMPTHPIFELNDQLYLVSEKVAYVHSLKQEK